MLWFDAIVQREAQAMRRWSVCVTVLLLSNWTTVGWAQTFLSGSTGADGPFQPTANTTLPVPTSGIFHFTTVTIPTGVTVTFTPNATNTPVAILATGDVSLAAGSIVNVSGQPGTPGSSTGPLVNPGGSGGPGGLRGGHRYRLLARHRDRSGSARAARAGELPRSRCHRQHEAG